MTDQGFVNVFQLFSNGSTVNKNWLGASGTSYKLHSHPTDTKGWNIKPVSQGSTVTGFYLESNDSPGYFLSADASTGKISMLKQDNASEWTFEGQAGKSPLVFLKLTQTEGGSYIYLDANTSKGTLKTVDSKGLGSGANWVNFRPIPVKTAAAVAE